MNSIAVVLFLGFLSCVAGVRQNIGQFNNIDAMRASSKICCCEVSGDNVGDDVSKCYWQKKVWSLSKSGCNHMSKLNPWTYKKRIYGVANKKGDHFDFNKAKAKAWLREQNLYETMCEALSGPVHKDGKGQRYVEDEVIFPAQDTPEEEDDEETIVTTVPKTPEEEDDEETIVATVPKTPEEEDDEETTVTTTTAPDPFEGLGGPEGEVDEDGDTPLTPAEIEDQDRKFEEEVNNLPTNRELKKAERSNNKQYCSDTCDTWPPRSSGSSETQKKGCHSPMNPDKFSNAENYCKNACEPEEDCKTPEPIVEQMKTFDSENR